MATMSRSIKSLDSHSSLFRALSSNPTPPPLFTRSFHSDDIFGDSKGDAGPFESTDDFENRLFGSNSSSGNGGGDGPITDSFYRKLDRIEKAHGHGRSSTPGFGPRSRMNDGGRGMVERFDTLSDGMDDKLKRAATTFQVSDEILNDDYAFRPDVTFLGGTTYTPRKSPKRAVFETTTAEVLRKADFRNVRFLANFLTEAGIIIKKSQTKISAKAQRKVAREIKTARALGLMPFSTMGTKPFFYGKTMEDLEEDYEYDTYYGSNMTDAAMEPVAES